MGQNLPTFFSNIIPWGIMIYSVTNFVFFQILLGSLNKPGLAGLILGVLQLLLPIRTFIMKIFWKPNTEETTSKTYDEIKYDFVFDYDRENPVTEKKALEEWINEIEGILSSLTLHRSG